MWLFVTFSVMTFAGQKSKTGNVTGEELQEHVTDAEKVGFNIIESILTSNSERTGNVEWQLLRVKMCSCQPSKWKKTGPSNTVLWTKNKTDIDKYAQWKQPKAPQNMKTMKNQQTLYECSQSGKKCLKIIWSLTGIVNPNVEVVWNN